MRDYGAPYPIEVVTGSQCPCDPAEVAAGSHCFRDSVEVAMRFYRPRDLAVVVPPSRGVAAILRRPYEPVESLWDCDGLWCRYRCWAVGGTKNFTRAALAWYEILNYGLEVKGFI